VSTGVVTRASADAFECRDERIHWPKPAEKSWICMNWTSTQHTRWREQCEEFAARQQPFRLDHVAGALEKGFCTEFCTQREYRQKNIGSSVLFSPTGDK
jgi:hypothetical protein